MFPDSYPGSRIEMRSHSTGCERRLPFFFSRLEAHVRSRVVVVHRHPSFILDLFRLQRASPRGNSLTCLECDSRLPGLARMSCRRGAWPSKSPTASSPWQITAIFLRSLPHRHRHAVFGRNVQQHVNVVGHRLAFQQIRMYAKRPSLWVPALQQLPSRRVGGLLRSATSWAIFCGPGTRRYTASTTPNA